MADYEIPEITTSEQDAAQSISREILAEVRAMPFSRWFDMRSAVADAAQTVRARLVPSA